MPGSGKLITVEGSEGVGKTTNMDHIERVLARRGRRVLRTREPGGTVLAERLRELLLERAAEPISPLAELLMIFAAREQHLRQVIRPALAAGGWVLCDRFTDATYAYQGGGRQIDPREIELLEWMVHGDLQPDLTIYLDIPVELGLERLGTRERDRFEQEDLAFFERVRAAYLERVRSFSRFRLVDAGQPLERVEADIEAVLEQFLEDTP